MQPTKRPKYGSTRRRFRTHSRSLSGTPAHAAPQEQEEQSRATKQARRALPVTVGADRRPDDWIFGAALRTSEMCQLIREFDFSKTSIGPLSAWPLCLKSALSNCLNSHFGIVLWLGKDLLCVYNECVSAPVPRAQPSRGAACSA